MSVDPQMAGQPPAGLQPTVAPPEIPSVEDELVAAITACAKNAQVAGENAEAVWRSGQAAYAFAQALTELRTPPKLPEVPGAPDA